MTKAKRAKQPRPTPAQVVSAREGAGLTQTQAAQLIYSTLRTWQSWELGERKMPPGLFELFIIKTGQTRVFVF